MALDGEDRDVGESEEQAGATGDDSPEAETAEEPTEEAEAAPAGRGMSRRRFLKYAVVGGIAAAAVGVGAYALLNYGGRTTRPAWFINDNTVDYTKVPQTVENGQVLHVAQWYQYWPPSFLDGFVQHIQDTYGKTITVVQEIYNSNEELFNWITQTGKKFDVMFPTNYTVETMERAGLLLNMNRDWLADYNNLFPWTRDPAIDTYAYRGSGASASIIAVPYQWGTTGLGFRTDRGWTRADIEADGYEIFWMNSYKGNNMVKRTMMMDDVRETIGQVYKRLGWNEQVTQAMTPTGIPLNPVSPYNGEYQWSQNETDLTKLYQARDALISIKSNLYDFNTSNQGPYLVNDIVWVDTAWSGDIMYAIRPNTPSPQPVDYWVPRHGGARWIDNGVIHREATNIFLAHEFIDFFLDAQVGATITDWNLYATPNAASFDLLKSYPSFGWDPREDPRIYADEAVGYISGGGAPILERCDYQKDLGPDVSAQYLDVWNRIKFG